MGSVARPRHRAYGANVTATLTDNALAVLRARYLAREHGVVVETPEQLFRRVARSRRRRRGARSATPPTRSRRSRARFERMMSALEFLPNSPTLMNAGRPLGQLAACFVVPVEDSTTGVFEAVRWAAEIQKTGGGTGFSFSRLRPAGDLVASTGGTASGPVSLMQVFDVATEAIKQGGTRRGANMGMLRVDHPDILEFIAIKLDPTRMRNFNLSVAVDRRVHGRGRAPARPTSSSTRAPARSPASSTRAASSTRSPTPPGPSAIPAWCSSIASTSSSRRQRSARSRRPTHAASSRCSPFESCTLGIDRRRPVRRAAASSTGTRLRGAIHDAVRFLDDVIDANRYPLPEIERATKATRKIGLGIMGWADALAALDIAYDSDAALALADRVAEFLETESLAASRRARRAPRAVPGLGRARAGSAPGTGPLRNATTTTIAPTGTISIIAGCASGIEPLYALAYRRNVLDGAELTEINPMFQRIAAERGFASPDAVRRGRRARRRARPHRRPGRRPAPVPDRARDRRRHARPDAGRLPAPRPRCRQQDDQPPARRDRRPTSKLRTSSRTSSVARESPSTGTAAATARCSSPARARRRSTPRRAARSAARCSSSRVRCRLCRHCGWSVCG